MIIIGYQGIGKSSLTMKHQIAVIDLESSNFFLNPEKTERDERWYIPYCNIAEDLSSQGYTVFMSSHKQVREYLQKCKEPVCAIFPSVELKDQWIKKLQDRYDECSSSKNYKAWMNAKDCYETNILDIKADCEKYGYKYIEIQSMNYILFNFVNELKNNIDINI